MKKYTCDKCGYVYNPEVGDPDHGIPPGTPFEDLADDWICPFCAAGKDAFTAEE
jgi:rubredoxin